MSQNRYWNLLAKKLAGEALPEELEELEELMRENPHWIYPAEQMENLFQLEMQSENYDPELAFRHHLKKMKHTGINLPEPGFENPEETVPARKNRKRIFFLSLTLFILAVSVFFLRNSFKTTPSDIQEKFFSEVTTKPGSKTTMLVLPDSSIVWLNAGSKLTYNENFGKLKRDATLTGEAFFEIRKNKIPFILHTAFQEIKVLGTSFNVKAYPNEKSTETSLIRGRIEITLIKRPGQKFILKPKEKLVVANEQEKNNMEDPTKEKDPIVVLRGITQMQDSTILETSWVENKLAFQDESFAELAKKMERWYGVKIIFKDDHIGKHRLSGTFTTETVQEALEELQMIIPYHFSFKSNLITITQF